MFGIFGRKTPLKVDLNIPIKIALLGDSSTGKSSFFERICGYNDPSYKFKKDYMATPQFDINRLRLKTNVGNINVHLWDTAGQEDREDMRPLYIKGSNAIIIMYDVCNRNTIVNVQKWLNDILSTCGNIPVVVIGNKIDKSHEIPNIDQVKIRDARLHTMYKNNKNITNILFSVKANKALVRAGHVDRTIKNGILVPFEKLLTYYCGKEVSIEKVY